MTYQCKFCKRNFAKKQGAMGHSRTHKNLPNYDSMNFDDCYQFMPSEPVRQKTDSGSVELVRTGSATSSVEPNQTSSEQVEDKQEPVREPVPTSLTQPGTSSPVQSNSSVEIKKAVNHNPYTVVSKHENKPEDNGKTKPKELNKAGLAIVLFIGGMIAFLLWVSSYHT